MTWMAGFRGAGALLLFVLGVLVGAPAPAAGQDPAAIAVSDTLVQVRLTDGSTLFGRVVAVEGDRVVLQTQGGTRVELERAQIRSVSRVQGRVRGGQVLIDDPHGTRLFFAPTGRSLAAGEGYFGVYELFFPFVTFGVTDRLVITGGTPVIPDAIGEFAYVGPKLLVFQGPRTSISAGVFTGFFEGGLAGIAYGVGTWGDTDNALTAGAGLAFHREDGEGDMADKPVFMLGGETRAGARTKFISENYFIPGESGALVSGGLRFWGERLSADAGVGLYVGDGDVGCCLPLVNFVYTFGKK